MAIVRTGVRGENSAPSAAASACRSTAPADQAASASIARYSGNSRFAGVAKTNISELYSKNPAAPSQVITAAADPRAASSIEQASTGTPASSTTSAVPRADPFITAVPRSTAGTANVSSELAAAVTASPADSHQAAPPGPITRLRPGRLVSWAGPTTLIAIAPTRLHRLTHRHVQAESGPGRSGRADGPGHPVRWAPVALGTPGGDVRLWPPRCLLLSVTSGGGRDVCSLGSMPEPCDIR